MITTVFVIAVEMCLVGVERVDVFIAALVVLLSDFIIIDFVDCILFGSVVELLVDV